MRCGMSKLVPQFPFVLKELAIMGADREKETLLQDFWKLSGAHSPPVICDFLHHKTRAVTCE